MDADCNPFGFVVCCCFFSNLPFCFLSFCLCFSPVLHSGREFMCSPSSCCQEGLTTLVTKQSCCCCHKSCPDSGYVAITVSIVAIACGPKKLCLVGTWAALRQHDKMELHCMPAPRHGKWVLGLPWNPGCGTHVVKAQQTSVLTHETV